MKVWFVPNFLYLSLPLFEKVIRRLRNVEANIIYLPGNSNRDIDEIREEMLSRQKLTKVPVRQVIKGKHSLFFRIKLIISSIVNFVLIYRLVENEKPDIVIVGSDVGPLNVRFLLGICVSQKIPVYIVYNTDVILYSKRTIYIKKKLTHFLSKFKLFIYLRSIFFKQEVPGFFAVESILYVISDNVKEKLSQRGIPAERIKVVGELVLDECNRNDMLAQELGMSGSHKVIAFYTECIEGVYGDDYATWFYKEIHSIFSQLPEHISIILKIHPREDKFAEFVTKTFSGNRFRIVNNYSAEEILSVSDLVIAHYSKILITSAVMRKRFLSINWMNDRQRTFLLKEEAHVLEISSPEKTKDIIIDALESEQFIKGMDRTINELSRRFRGSEDGIATIVNDIFEAVKVKSMIRG